MSERTDHDLLIQMAGDVKHIKESLCLCRRECVTQKEFLPVKHIAFGLVGLIAVAVVGALVKLIIQGAA